MGRREQRAERGYSGERSYVTLGSAIYLIHSNTYELSTASWFDHPRDLLHLVNVKRAEMPRPIIGLGHSFGGAHL